MRQPVQVLVYLACHSVGKWHYLLLQRVPRSSLGLGVFWQGITGAVEEGESLADAAMRELTEETRLAPSVLEQVDYSYSFPMQEDWRKIYAPGTERIVEHVFVAMASTQQAPILSREHDKWKWCAFERAMQLLFYPNNIEALRHCDNYLRRCAK